MTSPQPAPVEPATGQPIPPPPDQLAAEDAVVALLAAYVAAASAAGVAGTYAAAAAAPPVTAVMVVAALARLGIPRRAARATLELALIAGRGVPPAPTGPGKAAQRAVARAEPIWRARYLLNAAKRMGRAYVDPPRRPGQRPPRTTRTPDLLLPGSGPGQQEPTLPDPSQWVPERMTPAEAARHALELERRHLERHREAQRNRQRAAAAVDAAAGRWGEVLGWVAERDERTTWDCLRMHGHNFRAADPPLGMFPGAVHPRCRCTPGPPWPGARIVGRTGV